MGRVSPGTLIDYFEVHKLIGVGGMGEVYLARDTKLGRKVALKLVDPEQLGSADLVERFRAEARAIAQFSHPHIVAIYAVGEHEGAPYLALEYLQGETLYERLRHERPTLREALRTAAAIAHALAEAHRHGTLHRDLKPDNVIVPTDGRLRVLDFGLAKQLGGDGGGPRGAPVAEPRRSEMWGTPLYMSPEQWQGLPPSPAVDVWALGVILFEMLAGRHPFPAADVEAMRAVVCSAERAPELPQTAASADLPAALVRLVSRSLDKDPAGRPTSEELAAELERLLAGGASTDAEISPYQGLLSYTEQDAEVFFGREDEVEAFVESLRHRAVHTVIGPSGMGKSSFVHAGVVPRLRERGPWLVVSLRPGSDPFRALSACLARAHPALLGARVVLGQPTLGPSAAAAGAPEPIESSVADERSLGSDLRDSPGRLGLLLRYLASTRSSRVLLVVDQLEELYTLVGDADVRRRFFASIAGAADDADAPVRAVLVLRDDFVARAAETDGASSLIDRVTVLRPLSREALGRVLTRPLERIGYSFEDPRIVEDILSEVSALSASLPLVQFAMRMLWERRDAGRRLLLGAAYAQIGGVGGALAEHADGVLAGLPPLHLQAAREILLRLVTPERTRRSPSRRELLEGLGPIAAAVLDRLVEARLLAVRKADDGSRETLVVDTRKIRRGKQDDIVLRDGDVVVVPEALF